MKRPGFLNGVFVAAALALLASIGITVLAPVFTLSLLYLFVIPCLGLSYILYLFSSSTERVGRVTTLGLWTLVAATAWILALPLTLYLVVHVSAIWLIRSLYFHSSIVPALIDLGLNVLSLASAVWAFMQSGSPFLAVWCFFLVQSLFILIPPVLNAKPRSGKHKHSQSDNFERARRRAESAIRELFAH